MTRRILLTTLIVILAAGMLGCWFYFVGSLSAEGHRQARCRQVEVILTDSLESAIVDKEEVKQYVSKRALGRQTGLVNLDSIEKALRARGEVMSAQVYTSDDKTVAVRLTQRKPVIRFEEHAAAALRRHAAEGRDRLFFQGDGMGLPMVALYVAAVKGKSAVRRGVRRDLVVGLGGDGFALHDEKAQGGSVTRRAGGAERQRQYE